MKYRKGERAQLSKYFNSSEFDCHCPQCTETEIDPRLVTLLTALRTKTGPLRINSGFRCAHYQDELRARGFETSAGKSQHELGRAADVSAADSRLSGAEIEALAREVGFRAVGVAKNWAHLDTRDDKDRHWTYVRE